MLICIYVEYTSVCLIYFPESTADSKKSLGDINIPNTISKSFNCPPIILKFFPSEISMVIEISIDFNLLGIVEFQIYHFILPILQANLGKNMAKIISRRVICRNHIQNPNILYNKLWHRICDKYNDITDVIMSKIAEHTIKVCQGWKSMTGEKNKKSLSSKYGGSESTWEKVM